MEGVNFEKLNSENFSIWKHRMKALLITKGVGDAITNKDSEHSEKALALMCLCVSNEYVDLVANSESAQHAWTMLEDMQAGQTVARRLTLRNELTGLTKKPEESMMSYIIRGKQICTDLRAIDGSVTDIHLIDAILSGLPEEYANKIEMLTTLGETDMLKIQNQLLMAESAIAVRETSRGQVAFAARSRRPKITCSYCGRNGHGRDKCWYLNGLPPRLQRKSTNDADDEEKVALVTYALECGNASSLGDIWIVDSGVTAHVCAQREAFTSVTQEVSPQSILVGNGEVVLAKETGTVALGGNVELRNVLYCPELKVNLISVRKLMERGCNVYFENGECAVWRGKQKILSAVQKSGLYVIAGESEQVFSAMEWHRKLAHFGQMEKLHDTVVGIPTNLKWTANSCETCIQAKQARSAISKGNEENQAKIGELLHMDLMGPITPAGKNGEKYIVSILDEKSKLGVAKPICNKSQAPLVIKIVIRLMEKQTGNAVKTVRSDRGTEFLNAELQNFLEENGIYQQTSAPYTPQQNGNAERYNRTILDKVRAVLLDCGVDKCFWNFAVEYCALVRNRLPCQPHGLTPFEAVFGQKPDVSNMHIFGETCYVLKTPANLTGKMDAKSKPGQFVGIEPGTKDTYRIWCDGKLVLPRNVTFLGVTQKATAESDVTIADRSPLPDSSELLDSVPLVERQNSRVDHLEIAEQETAGNSDDSENVRSRITEERRYPLRERRPPQPYWTANVCLTEPLTLDEALNSPQHDDWKLALQQEVSSLSEQDVFDVVD
eukprot:scaffold2152_cov336-Pavlova_lutheri.AAC.3